MLPALRRAGYPIEPCIGQEESVVVVSFPAYSGDNVTIQDDVSIFEQFSLAAFLQRYWADNQVSCTISFNPETETSKISKCLDYFQYQLKGCSLLPRINLSMYPQAPYEAIDKATYEEMTKDLKPINWDLEDMVIEQQQTVPACECTKDDVDIAVPAESSYCEMDRTVLDMGGEYKADLSLCCMKHFIQFSTPCSSHLLLHQPFLSIKNQSHLYHHNQQNHPEDPHP